jgi:hypothetical protein
MQFKDIPQGTHFQDGSGRKFIKLQEVIPSGLNRKYWFESDGFKDTFNAIDYDGSAAKCPDWVDFMLI